MTIHTPILPRVTGLTLAAGPDYCTVLAAERLHAPLRDLTPLEAMYAYYGSDEAAA